MTAKTEILLSVFLFYSAKETGIVATCGGNVVCLIDVKTGRVLKRLKQDREGGQVSTVLESAGVPATGGPPMYKFIND